MQLVMNVFEVHAGLGGTKSEGMRGELALFGVLCFGRKSGIEAPLNIWVMECNGLANAYLHFHAG